MPLPVFFIGAAVATGGAGVVKQLKQASTPYRDKMNEDANALVESTTARLNAHRESCGTALSNLGEGKGVRPREQHEDIPGHIHEIEERRLQGNRGSFRAL